MSKKLIIIGASGHGKVVADIALLNGYEDIVFLDDDPGKKECLGFPVIGDVSLLESIEGEVFVGIGDNRIREAYMKAHPEREYPVFVHPRAVVARDVKLGRGTVVMAGAVINPGADIGEGSVVNTGSSVDHDSIVGDYSFVAPGARICGCVNIGDRVWAGAGSVVINCVSVCDDCMIGAGSTVLHDIKEPGTYFGTPARRKD